MANLREPRSGINPELLTGARWFGGKDRAVSHLRSVDRVEPPGAEGAAVELVEVVFDDGGADTYALALRDGRECAGHDALWPALARAAGVEALMLREGPACPRTRRRRATGCTSTCTSRSGLDTRRCSSPVHGSTAA